MTELGGEYRLEKPVEETILYEKIEAHIAAVTLNRPEKHNSFYPTEMFVELGRKMEMAVDDEDIKVIILRGNGPSFCTGDDLNRSPYEAFGGKPGHKMGQTNRILGIRKCMEAGFRDVMFCPKIVIAQVHGLAMGYGVMLVEACDLAIASESATLTHIEQRIGFGGFALGTGLTLPTIGHKRYIEWLLTGRPLTAREAKEWGLVNSVVPDEKLEEETLRWAGAVALHSADGLMIGKTHRWVAYEAMGAGVMHTSYYLAHPLFTNLKWREDELNFLKMRMTEGSTSDAFKAREKAWAKFGF